MSASHPLPGLPPGCTALSRLSGGESAEAWLVERSGERLVYRRRTEPGNGPAPAPQRALLEFLAVQGLPVAPVREAGADYLLSDWLPGEPGGDWYRSRCTPAQTTAAFALLARLHRLPIAPGTPPAQLPRDRWRTALAPRPGAFAELRRQAAAALAKHNAGAGPAVLLHGDFHPANVLFRGDVVTGLLDFDTAQLSRAEFDLGYGLLTFCGQWPAGTLERTAAAAALAAYGAVRPWEEDLLGPCMTAAALTLWDWCAALPPVDPRRGDLMAHFGGLLTGRVWVALPGPQP